MTRGGSRRVGCTRSGSIPDSLSGYPIGAPLATGVPRVVNDRTRENEWMDAAPLFGAPYGHR